MAHQMAIEVQQELRKLPGNNRCVDCQSPYPQWATVSYGTFMCLECSGRHRSLGVHISFVRSVTMDSWTDKQIRMMQLGGNEKFIQAFQMANVPASLSISQKYNTPQAEAYRQKMTTLAEGKSDTISIPTYKAPAASSDVGDVTGVEALKGESEEDYVSRQLRLREEAKARMQAKFGGNGMQGIGSGGAASNSNYSGGNSSSNDYASSLGSAFSMLSTSVSSVAASAATLSSEKWSSVQSSIADPNFGTNVKSTASSGWSTLSSGASSLWKNAQSLYDDSASSSSQNDGLFFPRTNDAIPTKSSYSGIGSSSVATGNDSTNFNQARTSPPPSSSSNISSISENSKNFNENSVPAATGVKGMALGSQNVLPKSTSPPPAPTNNVAKKTEKPKPKKDVDFFAEFGM